MVLLLLLLLLLLFWGRADVFGAVVALFLSSSFLGAAQTNVVHARANRRARTCKSSARALYRTHVVEFCNRKENLQLGGRGGVKAGLRPTKGSMAPLRDPLRLRRWSYHTE